MRRILSVIMVMLMVISLCACGEEVQAPATTAPAAQGQSPTNKTDDEVAVWIVSGIMEKDSTGELEYDEAYNLQNLTITAELQGETVQFKKGFSFDNAGRLIRETLEYPGEATEFSTYTYDEYGNEIDEGYSYTYDDQGRILTETDRHTLNVTTYTYDEQGRPVKEVTVSAEDGGTTYEGTWQYLDGGKRVLRVDRWGNKSTTCYDDQGREISSENSVYPTRTEYDENGNISKIVMAWTEDGSAVEFTYREVYVTAQQAEIVKQQQEVLKDFMILWG